MLNQTIKYTIYFSLFVQITTTILSLDGLKYTLDDKDKILRDILKLEAFVQFVETGFYVWVINSIKELDKITPRRYIDWYITTPTMLISTIIFMKYAKEKEENNEIEFWDFLSKNKENIKTIVILNMGMLTCGLLAELGCSNKYFLVFIGFIFFAYLFKHIYEEYAVESEEGLKLFYFLTIVWGLYGVAALMSVTNKNIAYNLLDIVSKNFYGLFIYKKILQLKTY